MTTFLLAAGIVAAALVLLFAFFKITYRVADVDKALVITGGKKPVIKVSGGGFVIPIIRKAQYFDLCMLTVKADRDEIKTKTAVPIITDWTAQIRPNRTDLETLQKAIVSFKERGQNGIIEDVKLTLTGAVRDIVASMTPEEVLRDKTKFAENVRQTVSDEMANMGMELVSLNIQDISDHNNYYDNMAAIDREDKRLAAENKKAIVEQDVRKQRADSEKEAAQSELASKLAIAEKERDNSLKQSGYKAEMDKAAADAEIAGELQKTIRERELAEERGKVEITRQEQQNLAQIKAKAVAVTKAETAKEEKRIASEANAQMQKIEADARVAVAEKAAEAIKIEAEANAAKIRKEGEAQAEVAKQKGLAEAEAERAKLMAQADGERALADARASNDRVNYEIEKVKIEAQARVEIATKTATIMANLGQNAEFVNIGGSAAPGKSGNVLLDTLAGIPELMKTLNVENKALNGSDFGAELSGLVSSIVGPFKKAPAQAETLPEAPAEPEAADPEPEPDLA